MSAPDPRCMPRGRRRRLRPYLYVHKGVTQGLFALFRLCTEGVLMSKTHPSYAPEYQSQPFEPSFARWLRLGVSPRPLSGSCLVGLRL